MNSVERFYATIERKAVDRPASWLGLPDKKALKGLFEYFEVATLDDMKNKIDDDIYPVELPYHSPISDAIYDAFHFGKSDKGNPDERTLTAAGFFEDYSDPSKVDDFNWPDPLQYISIEECKKVVENVPDDKAIIGILWSSHYQETCAAFGMETALIKMMLEPEMYKAIDDKIIDFYLKANERFYQATKGKLHGVLIGNDMGSQTGLMLSPSLVKEFILPGTKKLIDQAKSYGLKVIYHSCGSIFDIIPDLIEAGVDIIHPIQAKATGMEPQRLKENFGDKVAFCGGVDAQELMVIGSPEEVRTTVNELKNIFPTGLILSPSHEAILEDTKPQNIEALFKAVKNI
ncbi:uroporphyrinogen decarboxylase family protein [Clostridium grantii]|uniref:Uroporphyrinogen decarboxylase n=1 Tax=Clostridium grantii DSM 8605 TaxID=1121316 RepID=A0A1M5WFT5_9CLOT|nr:uroporphyrinogen decarboxylase family protein [Clostridium grantii]SHH86103.1 uroporphyrinogen decarboxylase [Clostridium grantii DSM 8605]